MKLLGLFFAICVVAWTDDDERLRATLQAAGFTGTVESQLEKRLGRPVDPVLSDLGRMLFFDKIMGLHSDNSCAGCHSPTAAFGDTQSIAIGVQNDNFVGPHRFGPRNQRRTPGLVNVAFYPKLMWNGRFSAASGDPFDNSQGFLFPAPEGATRFPPNDPVIKHLLAAQGHIPPTELTEAAGFTGTRGTMPPDFDLFDDGLGTILPAPDDTGTRNEPIRQAVLQRLNESAAYRELFGASFPDVAKGGAIDFAMVGRAIAEFEFTLVFANAPVDQFARGDSGAMTAAQKRGALLFFGKAQCV
ncbi:MAG TPA: cytochrome-c peroxidase, partial [Bryobacteraceae bacterium]